MRGVPAWYQGGLLCTGETRMSGVNMSFAKRASFKEPSRPLNATLKATPGSVREGDEWWRQLTNADGLGSAVEMTGRESWLSASQASATQTP